MSLWRKNKKPIQDWRKDEEEYNKTLKKDTMPKSVNKAKEYENNATGYSTFDQSSDGVYVIKNPTTNTQTRIHPYSKGDERSDAKSKDNTPITKRSDDRYQDYSIYDSFDDDWYYSTYSSRYNAPKRINVNICIFESGMSKEEISKKLKKLLPTLPNETYIIATRDDMLVTSASKVSDILHGISKFEIAPTNEQDKENSIGYILESIAGYILKIQIPGMISKSEEIIEKAVFDEKQSLKNIPGKEENNEAVAQSTDTHKDDTENIAKGVNSTLGDSKVLTDGKIKDDKITSNDKKSSNEKPVDTFKSKPKRRSFFTEIFKPSKPVYEINKISITIFGRYKEDMSDEELIEAAKNVKMLKKLNTTSIDINYVTDYDKNIVNFMAMGLSINVRRN